MKWYQESPQRWAREQEIARELMPPTASGVDEAGHAFICGTFILLSGSGHEYDRFRIKIVYPDKFPLRGRHPNVYLESHRQEWQLGGDSHIEPTWRMCLYVPLESGIDFRQHDATRKLFGYIHTFLFRQRMYQRDLKLQAVTGRPATWPGPERSHGDAGLREAVAARGRPGRNDPCVCGSGEKFKKCCLSRVNGGLR